MTRRFLLATLATLAGLRKHTANPPGSYLTPAMARRALSKLRQGREEPLGTMRPLSYRDTSDWLGSRL